MEGKRVLGNPNEIKEVQNAYEAYELMLRLNPLSVKDLLKAHKLMMQGLVPENGRFRSRGVGIFAGKTLVHMAPPAEFVPEHIHNLLHGIRHLRFILSLKVLFSTMSLSLSTHLRMVTAAWDGCGIVCF